MRADISTILSVSVQEEYVCEETRKRNPGRREGRWEDRVKQLMAEALVDGWRACWKTEEGRVE